MVYFDVISLQDWPIIVLEKGLSLEKLKKSIKRKVKEANMQL